MSGAAKPTRPIEALHPTAAFSKNAIVTGVHPITIGANSIIQLRAKLDSAHGSITIGERCIIAERAVLGLQSKAGVDSKGIFLGNGVVIQSGARVEGSLGEGTTVEPGAVVEKGSVVGKVCEEGFPLRNNVLHMEVLNTRIPKTLVFFFLSALVIASTTSLISRNCSRHSRQNLSTDLQGTKCFAFSFVYLSPPPK